MLIELVDQLLVHLVKSLTMFDVSIWSTDVRTLN